MRRGYNNGLIYKNDFIGVNLGADATSEHEWGIKPIRQAFGMRNDGVGIERRIITCVPKLDGAYRRALVCIVEKGFAYGDRSIAADALPHDLRNTKDELVTAWSEGSFGAVANTASVANRLHRVYEAFERKDIAMWLGGGGILQNAGLCIAIASKIPQYITAEWREKDLEAKRLQEDVQATGIEEELKRAGKRWFALSPRREGKKLVFWLNPFDQRDNNYGWFTIEDLRLWIAGKGPIPKTDQQRHGR